MKENLFIGFENKKAGNVKGGRDADYGGIFGVLQGYRSFRNLKTS